MEKKKKVLPKHGEESKEPLPRNDVPAMVTEVVEEDDVNDELELPVTPEPKTEEQPEPQEKVSVTEKSKEVVEELFSKSGAGITEISINKSNASKPLMWWAVVVIVAVCTTGAGLFFMSGKSPSGGFPALTAKPTPTNTPVPTATPVPLPAKTELKVQVLNGGGVAGAATKMRKFLEDNGYTVTEVGNTDEYSYEKTEIQTKTGYESLGETLKTEMEGKYTVSTVDATLSASSDFDLVVIVGKE